MSSEFTAAVTVAAHAKPYRVIVLGLSTVGKTSLLRAMCGEEERAKLPPLGSTVGMDFVMLHSTLADGSVATLQLFDSAGQEAYDCMTRSYLRNNETAILVFKLCDFDSWRRVQAWFHDVRARDPTTGIVLVGNKSDLIGEFSGEQTRDWAMIWDEAHAFAEEHNIPLVATSALYGDGVADVVAATVASARQCKAAAEKNRIAEEDEVTRAALALAAAAAPAPNSPPPRPAKTRSTTNRSVVRLTMSEPFLDEDVGGHGGDSIKRWLARQHTNRSCCQ
jgi:small GTP-binding protein